MSELKENVLSEVPTEKQASQTDLAVLSDPVQTDLEANQSDEADNYNFANQKFANIRSDVHIVSLDPRSTVETEADTEMKYLLDLLASLRSRHILTGKLEGVESSEAGDPRAVLRYGSFKVLIPSFEMMEPPEDMRGMNPNEVMRYLISKRLGAEIDFIVKGIDQEAGVVVASRNEAMTVRRRQFYFGQDREGNNILYEGAVAEARVTSVIRSGIFVELFGVETYIPATEVSYQRILDCGKLYAVGQKVLVKILNIDRSQPKRIQVSVSIKQTKKNPYDSIVEKYIPGNHYIGTVTMVDVNGVFVALDGGVDCLCVYPVRGIPLIGSRVTVRIYKVNPDTKRITGDIVHTASMIE